MVFSFRDSSPGAFLGLRRESLWGLLIMLAGIPIYLIVRWHDRAKGANVGSGRSSEQEH